MAELTRDQVLNILRQDWATYVERFHHLSPAAQAEFLDKQGYNSLADLLAHIYAWWAEGQRVIQNLCNDPDFEPPDYDVDAFNAKAVERYHAWGELEVLNAFEQTRSGWEAFINNLPDGAFQNQHITHRIYLELVYHMQEHEL